MSRNIDVIACPSRALRRILLLGAAILPVAGAGFSTSAYADCTPSGAGDIVVTCAGSDTDGVTAAATGSLTVDFADGASVTAPSIAVNGSGTIGVSVVNGSGDAFTVDGGVIGLYLTSPAEITIDTSDGSYEGGTAAIYASGASVVMTLTGGSATGVDAGTSFGASLTGSSIEVTTDGTELSGGSTGLEVKGGGLTNATATVDITGGSVTGTGSYGINSWDLVESGITLTDTTVSGGVAGVQALARDLAGASVSVTLDGTEASATGVGGTAISMSGETTTLTTSGESTISGDRGVYITGAATVGGLLATLDITDTTVTATAGAGFEVYDVATIGSTFENSTFEGTTVGLALTGDSVTVGMTGGSAKATAPGGIGGAFVGATVDLTTDGTDFEGDKAGLSVNGAGTTASDVDIDLTGGTIYSAGGRAIEVFGSADTTGGAGVDIDVETDGSIIEGQTRGIFVNGANTAGGATSIDITVGKESTVTGDAGQGIQAFAGSLEAAAGAQDPGTWYGNVGDGAAALTITVDGTVTSTDGSGIEGWIFGGTGSTLHIVSTGSVTASGTLEPTIPAAGIVARSVGGAGTIDLDVSGLVIAPGDAVNSVGDGGSTSFDTLAGTSIQGGRGIALTDRVVTVGLVNTTVYADVSGLILAGTGEDDSTATVTLTDSVVEALTGGTSGTAIDISDFETADVTLQTRAEITSQTVGIAFSSVVAATLTLKTGTSITGPTAIQGGKGDLDVILETGSAVTGDIVLGDGDSTVSFAAGASVDGDIDGTGAGDTSLTFEAGEAATYAGVLTGLDSVIVDAGGTWTLTGDSSALAAETKVRGILAVNGKLGGTIEVQDGGTLHGTGTVGDIDVRDGGVLAPGNSIGTLSATGDVLLDGGATYEVEVEPMGTSDMLKVTGAVTIGDGAILRVIGASYNPGTVYTIITAGGGVTGQFEDLDTVSAFLESDVQYETNAVLLTLDRNDVAFADLARTRNQAAVADALESLTFGDPLYDAIVQLDAGDAQAAYDQLSGEIHASLIGAFVEDSHHLRDAVNGRLIGAFAPVFGQGGAAVAEQVPTASAAVEPVNAVWLRAFGAWADLDGDGNAAAADRSSAGFFIGADRLIGADWRVGVVAGYSHTDLDVDGRASSATSDDYHLGAYAGGQLGAIAGGVIGVRLGAAYTWHQVETDRDVGFTGFSDRLSADYDAGTAQIFGEVGYRADLADVALEPFAGLAYVNVTTDGFDEKGGAAALSGGGDTQEVGYSTLGLRAATVMPMGEATVALRGMVGWRHAFGDDTPDATLAFGGSDDFAVAGTPIARDSLVLEAGFEVELSQGLSVGASYSGAFGDGAQDQSVRANLAWKF